MRLFLISILIIFLSSCGHYRWIHKHEDEVCAILDCCPQDTSFSSVTLENDTAIKPIYSQVEDSSFFNYYLRCDSNNQVLLQKVENLSQDKDSIRYELRNNILRTRSYWRDSIETLHRIIQTTKTRKDTIIMTETEIKEVPKRTPFTPWYIFVGFGVVILGAFILGNKI